MKNVRKHYTRFVPALAAFLMLFVAVPVRAQITVSPNVQVSKQNSPLFHGEVLIGADPDEPNHLIACSSMWPAQSDVYFRTVAYVTFDGGATWKTTNERPAQGLDSVCDIGFGVTYLGSGGSDRNFCWGWESGGLFEKRPFPGHTYLARSKDGGVTWSPPVVFPWLDRDWIAIDKTNSRFRGRIYHSGLNVVSPKQPSSIDVTFSTDNGRTFSRPVKVYSNPANLPVTRSMNSAPMAILSDGTVVILDYGWLSTVTARIMIATSMDGGVSFSKPHLVVTRNVDLKVPISEGFSPIPVIASDISDSPFHNRLYVIWEDFRYGQGNILLVHSDDAGKTWSNPTVVDDAPPVISGEGPHATNPAIAVNQQGVVGVVWYDERGIPNDSGARLRFAMSTDGGDTFSRSVPVSEAPSLLNLHLAKEPLRQESFHGGLNFDVDMRYGIFGGDTSGLAVDANGAFHPLWIDNRTGVAQVWTAAVNTHTRAVLHGDRSLESLDDVTKSVVFRSVYPLYDRPSQTISVKVAVVNSSARAIGGPIYVREAQLTSIFGDIQASNPDSTDTEGKAVWAFRPTTGALLEPGAQTEWRTLTFHITNPIHHELPGSFGRRIFNLRYEAYASTSK